MGGSLGGCSFLWKLVFASPGRDPEARAREASAAKMTQAEKGDAENGKEKGGEKEKEQRGVKRPIVPALVPESLQEVGRWGRAWDSASGRGRKAAERNKGRKLARF